MNQFLELWILLVISATAIQFKQTMLAFKFAWFARNGVYRLNIHNNFNKAYVWSSKPTTHREAVDPDIIVAPDGSLLFFDRKWLHFSFIITFLPIIPGIAFFLVKWQLQRFKNDDKYLLNISYIHDILSDSNPSNGSEQG
jgi:hypothetical protein